MNPKEKWKLVKEEEVHALEANIHHLEGELEAEK
jgi:hypothetical protein